MVSFSKEQIRVCHSVHDHLVPWLATLPLLTCGGFIPVNAALADVPRVAVNATTVYDDNIFLAPSQLQKDLAHGGADIGNTITVTGSYGANLDPAVLTVQASAQKTFFAYDSRLNVFEYTLNGDLMVTGGHGDATLSLTRSRVASTYEDLRVGPRNIQTLSQADLNTSIVVAGALNVLLDATGTQKENSLTTVGIGGSRKIELSAGFGYHSRTLGNILALDFRYTRSSGLNTRTVFVDDVPLTYRASYVQRSAGVRLEWHPSVIWSVKGRVGYARFTDLSGIANNKSGLIGDLKVVWSPSPFLKATINADRSFSGTQEIYTDGTKTLTFGADISAQPFEEWSATLGYQYRNRRFSYDFLAPEPFALSRNERVSDVKASVSHPMPFRGTVSLQVDHRWRTSNLVGYSYKDTAGSIAISIPITQ